MSSELKGPRFEKPVERRDFLGMAAMFSFFGTLFAALVGMLKLPMPAVFPETDSRFPIGTPDDFPPGSMVHLTARRLWISSDETGIAVVSAICPHLGCICTRDDQGIYICPCHGSQFDATGKVFSGPSPRGLLWLDVSLGPDGRLIVDSAREVPSDTRFKV